jgi:hypothetical protein
MLTSLAGRKAIFAPLLAFGAASAAWEFERRAQQPAAPRGVVGNWSVVDDGGQALRVDGAAWSGKTDSSELAATAQRIFGAPAPQFVKNNIGEGSFPIAVVQAAQPFTNGTIRVRFKMVAGATDQNAGILFGLNPDGSYHYVRYNTKDGDVALWKYVNGAREVIAHGTAHAKLALGTWQELTVTVNGPSVKGWVVGHDSVRIEHTLPAATSGRVGLWVKRDAITHFRDFQLTAAR